MIRKIQNGEYLKRFDNMTAGEQSEYLSRVGDWLSTVGQELTMKGGVFEARMQNVLQVSTSWNDTECQAFEEGALLLSALVATEDTWLPDMLYVKSAKRAIQQMFEVLWSVEEGCGDSTDNAADNAPEKPKEEPAEGTRKGTQAVGEKSAEPAGDTYTIEKGGSAAVSNSQQTSVTQDPEKQQVSVSPVLPNVVRPKHFDQYAYLLPEKTQEKIAKYGPLMRELEEVRRKMDLLMDDKTSSADDRAAWAKRATAIDKELNSIRREADSEWDKLVKSGRVVMDDFGNARVVSSPQNDEAQDQEPTELTSEQKARRRDLRKWLVDTRRGNGNTREEHVKKWTENFREYLTLAGDKAFEDEKIKEAIGHYGIDVEKLKS